MSEHQKGCLCHLCSSHHHYPAVKKPHSSLAAMPGSASYDDWQVAYEEAAGHLEYLSGISTDQTDGERDAQRKLAARLRAAAKRMTPNAKAVPPPDKTVASKKNVQ